MGGRATKTRILSWAAAIVVVLLGGGVVLLPWWAHAARRAVSQGPEHRFELDGRPAFLSEEVALDMARETLRRDGYDPNRWEPLDDGRTTAPDGRPDRHFARNALDPNSGYVQFSRSEPWGALTVSLELDGATIVSHVWQPR